MSPLRARVEKGRLVLDEPTTLPDGTIIDLIADDEGDDLTDEERRALHEALSASPEVGRGRSPHGQHPPSWTNCVTDIPGETAGPNHT